jgi:MFS family permease
MSDVRSARIALPAGSLGAEFRTGLPVLIACFIGSAVGHVFPFYTLTLFMPSLNAAFGWTPSQMGYAITFLTGGMFIAGPVAGYLCDRFGPRKVIIPSTVMVALLLAGMTQLNGSIWSLYLGYALFPILGMGAGPVVYSRAVAAWFSRGRGLALGLMFCSTGITTTFGPTLIGGAIQKYGWQGGWLLMAAVALPQILIAFLLLKDRQVAVPGPNDVPATGMSMSEAARTRVFWVMFAASLLMVLMITATVIHLVPMLLKGGLDRAGALGVASMLGLGIFAGRICSGFLLDRLHGPYVAALVSFLAACGVVLLGTGAPATLSVAVFFVGCCVGAEADIFAYFTSRYFGMKWMGEIFGFLYGGITLGTAIAPLAMGALLAQFGGAYEYPLYILAGIGLVAMLLCLSLPKYPVSFAATLGMKGR